MPNEGKCCIFWCFAQNQAGSRMREAFLLTVGAFLLTVELLCLQSVEVLVRHSFLLRSSTVSKKARAVSKKAPKHNCKQKTSALSRKLPTVSNKAGSLKNGHSCRRRHASQSNPTPNFMPSSWVGLQSAWIVLTWGRVGLRHRVAPSFNGRKRAF